MKSLWFSDIINEQTIDVKWDVTKRSYIRHSKNYGERCQQKKKKKKKNWIKWHLSSIQQGFIALFFCLEKYF